MKKALLMVTCLSQLVGCATTVSEQTHASSPTDGKITLIREYAEPAAFNISVSIDDQKVASIKNKSHATFSVSEGSHILKLEWPPLVASEKDFPDRIKMGANEHKYYKISQNVSALDANALTVKATEPLMIKELSAKDAEGIISKLK